MLKILDPTLSKHRNKFIVEASGYYGDMDASFHVEEAFDLADDAQALYEAFDTVKSDEHYPETREELVALGHDECVVDGVPIDCGDMLPSVEFLRIIYADVNGFVFNVEVIDA